MLGSLAFNSEMFCFDCRFWAPLLNVRFIFPQEKCPRSSPRMHRGPTITPVRVAGGPSGWLRLPLQLLFKTYKASLKYFFYCVALYERDHFEGYLNVIT